MLSLLVRRVSDVPIAVHTYYKHQHCSSYDLEKKKTNRSKAVLNMLGNKGGNIKEFEVISYRFLQ